MFATACEGVPCDVDNTGSPQVPVCLFSWPVRECWRVRNPWSAKRRRTGANGTKHDESGNDAKSGVPFSWPSNMRFSTRIIEHQASLMPSHGSAFHNKVSAIRWPLSTATILDLDGCSGLPGNACSQRADTPGAQPNVARHFAVALLALKRRPLSLMVPVNDSTGSASARQDRPACRIRVASPIVRA